MFSFPNSLSYLSKGCKYMMSEAWSQLTSPTSNKQNLLHSSTQWCTQDEQVTWAQHGQIQCMHNTHLLGELGHAPAMTLKSLLR